RLPLLGAGRALSMTTSAFPAVPETSAGASGVGSVRAARLTCTWSTMPTIVVSTGTSAGRNGKLDSLPRTQYMISPAPAPVESAHTMRLPVLTISGVKGCTSSRRWPSISLFFTVDQTQPTTFPRYMASSQPLLFIQAHIVYDAHNRGIDRSIL